MAYKKTTISMPEPIYLFAVKEATALAKREGESRVNLSFFIAELIRERREEKDQESEKPGRKK